MELKTKYQYTYFIHPYIIDETRYEKYILKMLRDKNCSLKIFEKEKDFDIYSYFLPQIRNYLFPTFEIRAERLKELNNMRNEAKSTILAKHPCVCFNYNLGEDVQGKIGAENGIFFRVNKIEIICFNTGVCFFTMKVHIEESDTFNDILNFNYKFRDINSEFRNLKEYENIKIQTDTFKDIEEISTIISQVTGISKKNGKNQTETENINNSRFYTYSYACIDSEKWNEKNNFSVIENEFLKYANVLPNNYGSDFNKESKEQNLAILSKMKYARIGITKLSSNLLCSGIDTYNYTKLPYEYENEYFYTYILGIYQKILLTELNKSFRVYDKIPKMRSKFIEFTKYIWMKEITNNDTGTLYFNMLKESLELETLYEEIQKKYDIIYKELNIEKNNRIYFYMMMMLLVSLIFNTATILVVMALMT